MMTVFYWQLRLTHSWALHVWALICVWAAYLGRFLLHTKNIDVKGPERENPTHTHEKFFT